MSEQLPQENEWGPLGYDEMDASTQEALAEYLCGLWLAADGAARLARRLKQDGRRECGRSCTDLHELRRLAKGAPFVVDWLRTVENELCPGGLKNTRDVYERLRLVLRNLLRQPDQPIRVEGRGE